LILVVVLLLAALSVPVARGDLARLSRVRFRALALIGAALAIQTFVLVAIPDGPRALLGWLHVASYLLGGAFVLLNLRLPGLWLVAVGGGLNLLAIAANSGVMPASATAVRIAGDATSTSLFVNSSVLSDPNLSFLGDVFALPAWVPFANVFSLGDVLIVLGVVAFLHGASRSRLRLPGGARYGPVLRDANFRKVWAAQAASSLGDFVYELSVAATLAARGGSPASLAVLLVCYMGAAAAAGLGGGGVLDRRSRRLTLVVADVVRGGAVATLMLVEDPGLAHLAIVAAILGAGGAVFQAGVQASLPGLVERRHLVAANALLSLTFNAAVMAGPVIGGIAVAQLGVVPGIAINASSFALSALLILRSRLADRARGPAQPALQAIREGLRYAIRTPLVRWVLMVMGLVMAGTAIRAPLEPLLVLRELDGTPQTLGLVEGSWGLGMVLGSLWAPWLAGRFRREALFLGGVAMVAVGTILVPPTSSVGILLLLSAGAGSGNGLGSVAYESMLQEETPDRVRGRVLAAVEGVVNLAFLVGAGLTALGLVDAGVRGGYVVAGAVLVLATVLGVATRPRAGAERPAPVAGPSAVLP
jgi:MFS family permease